MKYTILGFSQPKVIEINKSLVNKITIEDLAILRWLHDFRDGMSKIIVENDIYYWLDYKYFLQDMPIIDITKDRLYRKLMKLVSAGFLTHKTVFNKGTYSYYGFGERFLDLFSDSERVKMITIYGENLDGGTVKVTEGYGENTVGGTVKTTEQNNPSTKYNPSTKINTPYNPPGGMNDQTSLDDNSFSTQRPKSSRKPKKLEGDDLRDFEKFYDDYDNKVARKKAEDAWLNLTPEQKSKALEVAKQWVKTFVRDKQYQPMPSSWLNGKRFMDDLGAGPVNVEELNAGQRPMTADQKQQMSDIFRKKYGVTYHPPISTPYMAPAENVLSGKWWIDPQGFLHNCTSSKMNWAVYKSGDGDWPGNPGNKSWFKTT
jgi:hypothetical protein